MTPVSTGVRGRHLADDEIENAFIWSVDPESIFVHIDVVLPVHDSLIVVIALRCELPKYVIRQYSPALEFQRLAMTNGFVFTCDAV